MSWANLGKLAVAKPAADGSPRIVIVDDRPRADIVATRALSTLVAICRVVHARYAIAKKFGGRGTAIYACTGAPAFLADAVAAAGGVVIDAGTPRETAAPLPLSAQLDTACFDLATAARRRASVGSFAAALEVREHELERRRLTPDPPEPYWTAVLELCALAGEVARGFTPGSWKPTDEGAAVPLALDLAGGTRLLPETLARTIVEHGGPSMMSLALLARPQPQRGAGRRMPFLQPGDQLPLDRIMWSPLIEGEDGNHAGLPIIAWGEDHPDTVRWPRGEGPPPAEIRRASLANLARVEVTLDSLDLPGAPAILVHGDAFAAETILDPAAMQRVSSRLGAIDALMVIIPRRGELFAVDARRAFDTPQVMVALAELARRYFAEAAPRDKICPLVLLYSGGKPSGVMEL